MRNDPREHVRLVLLEGQTELDVHLITDPQAGHDHQPAEDEHRQGEQHRRYDIELSPADDVVDLGELLVGIQGRKLPAGDGVGPEPLQIGVDRLAEQPVGEVLLADGPAEREEPPDRSQHQPQHDELAEPEQPGDDRDVIQHIDGLCRHGPPDVAAPGRFNRNAYRLMRPGKGVVNAGSRLSRVRPHSVFAVASNWSVAMAQP